MSAFEEPLLSLDEWFKLLDVEAAKAFQPKSKSRAFGHYVMLRAQRKDNAEHPSTSFLSMWENLPTNEKKKVTTATLRRFLVDELGESVPKYFERVGTFRRQRPHNASRKRRCVRATTQSNSSVHPLHPQSPSKGLGYHIREFAQTLSPDTDVGQLSKQLKKTHVGKTILNDIPDLLVDDGDDTTSSGVVRGDLFFLFIMNG
mgnify:CR=1 FL=1